MEVAGERYPQNRASNTSQREEHNFDWRGVLSSQTERRRIGVVEFVYHLVKRAVVQSSVEPIVPGILHDEEDGDVESHLAERGEGDTVVHAEVGCDGVE